VEPGSTFEIHKGSPFRSAGAWITPPDSRFFPENHASISQPHQAEKRLIERGEQPRFPACAASAALVGEQARDVPDGFSIDIECESTRAHAEPCMVELFFGQNSSNSGSVICAAGIGADVGVLPAPSGVAARLRPEARRRSQWRYQRLRWGENCHARPRPFAVCVSCF
jgi:hypothetical protein